MTAATIRAANRILTEGQVVQGNIVSLTEIGSEGSIFSIYPHPDLMAGMSLAERHRQTVKYLIARNGQVERL